MSEKASVVNRGADALGKITGVQGEVVIINADGKSINARSGQSLEQGSTLKTLGSSVVVLNIDGHGAISLGHDEELTLDETLLALLKEINEGGAREQINFELIAQTVESGESLDEVLPPAAAGGDVSSASSSVGSSVRVELTGDAVSPNSGFQTQGLASIRQESFINDPQQFNSRPSTSGITDFSVDQDAALNMDLSEAFSDNDPGQTLTFSVDSLPDGLSFDEQTGVLSGAPTNDAVFTQDGSYVVTVTATDDSGAVNDTATTDFTIQVNNVNDAPVAGDAIILGTISEDSSITFDAQQLLAGASDIDAFDLLSVAAINLTAGDGDITANSDGSFTYTPDENWFGDTRFSYTIDDGAGGQVESSGSLSVTAVNDVPVAMSDGPLSTTPFIAASINVLANDVDVDGDTLTVAEASANSGTVVIGTDGVLTYTPNDGFFGADTITYTVSDGNGETSQTTVPVSVVYAPGFVTIADTVVTADTLPTFSGTSGNLVGDITVVVNGVSYAVTPDATGAWSFTLPAGAELIDGNYTVEVSAIDILDNVSSAQDDFTVDAFEPTVSLVDQGTIGDSFPTFQGTSANTDGDIMVTINGVTYNVTPDIDGSWEFTAPEAIPDGDYTVTVVASDAQGNVVTVDDQIVIDAFAPMVTIVDLGLASATPSFSGTSANADGNLMLSVNGQSYTVTPEADGTWAFTVPNADLLPDGNYTATILASDDQGNSASARDDFIVDVNFPAVTIDALDMIDTPLPTFSGTSANTDGPLVLTINGVDYDITPGPDGAWVFTLPDAAALGDGNYSASIQGSDAQGNTSSTDMDFVVNAVDDIPVISGDVAATVVEDSARELTANGDLNASGGDPGEDIFIAGNQVGDYGVFTNNEDGTWSYSAVNANPTIQGLSQTQSLTENFVVTNADGVTTQTITITISGADDVPTISGDVVGSVTEDTGAILSTSGALSASGGDAGEDQFEVETLTGLYGELSVDGNGNWRYAADNSQVAIQGLSETESLADIFTVTNADGVTTQMVTITINGTDDVPVISGDTTAAVTEDAAVTLTTAGVLNASAGDAGEDQFEGATFTGVYGALEIDVDGNWRYTADNSQAAIQALESTDTLSDIFTVTNADGVTTQTVTITINGSDDVPIISGDVSAAVTEDAAPTLTTSGVLTASGGDAGEDQFDAQTTVGLYGEFSVDLDGNWRYSADNSQSAIQGLNETQSLSDVFVVTNADGVTTQTVTITINGTNDVPVITGDVAGAVNEDAAPTLTASGTLSAAGGDAGEDQFEAATLTGLYGELVVDVNGNWSYAADNSQPVIQGLSETQSLSDVFTVTNADGVTTQTVTMTINGADDVPAITGDITGTVIEDAATTLTVNGALSATAGDAGEDQFQAATFTGLYGELSVDVDGNWRYSADNSQAAIQGLDGTASLSDTFTVTNADGVTTQTVTITIDGSDDVPMISGDTTGVVTEDADTILTASGALSASGGDVGEDQFQAATLSGLYGELSVDANGNWRYSANNSQAAIQGLSETQSLSDAFTVTNADGVTTQIVTMTINGTDDVPVISGDTTGTVTEDSAAILTASGVLSASGGDNGEDLFEVGTFTGTYGVLTVDANGNWNYEASNNQAAIQALSGASTPLQDSFTVTNADGVTSETVTISIRGSDDVPVVTAVVLTAVNEDSGALTITSANLMSGVVDADAADTPLVSNLSISSGNGVLTDNLDGTWTFTPAADWSGDVEFSYDYVSGADSGTNSVSVEVTAVADAPTLTLDADTVEDSGAPEAVLPVSTGLLLSFYDELNNGDGNAANQEAAIDAATPTSQIRVLDGFGTTKEQVSGVVQTDGSTIAIDDDDAYSVTGLIFLEAGRAYEFTGYRDDSLRIELGGQTIISTTGDSWGNYGDGVNLIRFSSALVGDVFTPTEDGFYTLEMYVNNRAGPGQFSLNMVVDGGDAQELNADNFNIYSSVSDLVSVGGQFGDFVAGSDNPDGGYFPLAINSGLQDTPIELSNISALVSDSDGSESIVSIVVDGVPAGATLTDGVNSFTATALDSDIDVFAEAWDLSNIQIIPVAGFTGNINLAISATSEEGSNGDQATTTENISVTVDAIADVIGGLDSDLLGSDDAITGTDGNDILSGTSGNDIILAGLGNDMVDGGDDVDSIDGGGGNDILSGGAGIDVIVGGLGDDIIRGGTENDILSGGEGADILFGDLGDDSLTGGSGQDSFAWQTSAAGEVDTISDFVSGAGGDILDLSDVLQGENSSATSLDSYLDFSSDGTNTTIAVDVDGNGSGTDMSIVLEGVDLTLLGNDQTIIQNLLDNGNVITD